MQQINQLSRVTAEFTLQWESDGIHHTEVLWAYPVSLWRDVLNGSLRDALLGETVGAVARVEIPAEQFNAPYRNEKKILVSPSQFTGVDRSGAPLSLSSGRFYPQGMLRNVGGVYKQTLAPCRFVGNAGERLQFDLNHPLAGRDLILEMKVLGIEQVEKERGGRCEDWFERVVSDGPGMQARFSGQKGHHFAADNFIRADEAPDQVFYSRPRLVHHLDSTARGVLGEYYARLIPGGIKVLDLMGSWESHMPESSRPGWLTVLGMNAEEMSANPMATETIVQDLNANPSLSFSENSYDAAICTASVEYLTDPLAVLTDLKRVVRPGAKVIFSFTNRWFPPKAIALWEQLHEFERLGWVAELFHAVGGFEDVSTLSYRGQPRPVDDPYQNLWLSDPVYMAWASKK